MPLITLTPHIHSTLNTHTLSHSHISLSLSNTLIPQTTNTPTFFHHQVHTGAPIAIPSVATRCSRRPRHIHTNCEGARKWKIAPIECRLWHSQGIQARSWVSVGEFRRIVIGFKCLQEMRSQVPVSRLCLRRLSRWKESVGLYFG
ncbi:hypothetical protein PIB30_116700 [Stylosanthes scabra]|uniref:Uncharacterized protein n=1 Tax=Stylosanthes scabra TaxID=79078 RepID=A0ABU6SRH5_9FABA|nr:hypothetical protein [Stylosanthes scabra]